MMQLMCRFNWHRWGKWQTVPVNNNDPANAWAAGQLRQCADCFLLQAVKVGSGYAFNSRPLRVAVSKHINELQLSEDSKMHEAAGVLREALNADLGVPKE